MTFTARDSSQREGSLIELYRFVYGSSTYYQTSGDVAQTHLSQTWDPTLLRRGPFLRGQQGDVAGLVEIAVHRDHPIGLLYLGGRPLTPIAVTIFARHRSDSETLTVFLGQIASARLLPDEIILTAVSLEGSLKRKLPRFICARTCQHMLYGDGCGLDPTDFDHVNTVSAVAGRVITVTGLSAWAGSDATKAVSGVLLKSGLIHGFIEAQSGDTITLVEAAPAVAVSDTVTVYAGCDRLIDTCFNRFNNVARFGGVHAMPDKDPWSGAGIGLEVLG